MKKFFKDTRSSRNGEKDVSDSPDGSYCQRNCYKDSKRGYIHLPMSKLKPSGCWYRSVRNISSAGKVSKNISPKRSSMKISSKHKPSRLVSEVVNEVLNFEPNNSSKCEESKIFQKFEEENCINTIKSHIDVINENKDKDFIINFPSTQDCINLPLVSDLVCVPDTSINSVCQLKTELQLDSDNNYAPIINMDLSIHIESTSSDSNGSLKAKRPKLEEDSSDNSETELCNPKDADEVKPEMDNKVHKTSNGNEELLNKCKGVIRTSNKAVLVDFISPRLLENPLDVHRVMSDLFGLKSNDFVAITKNKINKCYSFLIFEEPLRVYLSKLLNTEAGRLVPWNTNNIQDQVSLATIISLNCSNTTECHIDFKKAAKKLLNCLLGNIKELYKQFCYDATSNDMLMENESTRINDSMNHNDIKTIEGVKNFNNKTITIHNVLNGKNHVKEKIFFNPSMSAEEEKQKQFFNMMKNFFKEDEAKKETIKSQKIVPNIDREKAKSKILERCLGTKNQGKKYVVAMVRTAAAITSYKEIKDVLILLFGIKPNEFCGMTKSNFAPIFNLIIEEDAYLRYRSANPYPEIGELRPWDDKDLKALIPELAILCASISSNAKSASHKKLAKTILEHIRSIDHSDLQKLIILSHSDSQRDYLE